jgi:hypothetical protein
MTARAQVVDRLLSSYVACQGHIDFSARIVFRSHFQLQSVTRLLKRYSTNLPPLDVTRCRARYRSGLPVIVYKARSRASKLLSANFLRLLPLTAFSVFPGPRFQNGLYPGTVADTPLLT